MEKYGFVYLWYDRKHKRFYIGCHWGREDDGYICSSNWMRNSYRKRPEDFKRRVISRIYTNRKDLFAEEFRILGKISEYELGTKYYNLSKVHPNHWSTNPESLRSISEKASSTLKKKHKEDPIFRAKYEESMKNIDRSYRSAPECIEKQRKSMKKTMAEKFPAENRKYNIAMYDPNTGELTEAYKFKIRKGVRNYYDNWTEEKRKLKIQQAKERKGFYNSNRRLGKINSDDHNKKIGKANGQVVVIDGVEYYSQSEAARCNGCTQVTVRNRIKSGKYPTWYFKDK